MLDIEVVEQCQKAAWRFLFVPVEVDVKVMVVEN